MAGEYRRISRRFTGGLAMILTRARVSGSRPAPCSASAYGRKAHGCVAGCAGCVPSCPRAQQELGQVRILHVAPRDPVVGVALLDEAHVPALRLQCPGDRTVVLEVLLGTADRD